MHLFPISLALTPFPSLSHHLSLIHLFILPSSPCSPLGLSLSPSLCCICCISHTRWRHWVVYSYHLVGAFIFFTIHVLPLCHARFSFHLIIYAPLSLSASSHLWTFFAFHFLMLNLLFFLLSLAFFFHVNSSLIGHSLHNWSPLNVVSPYTTFITL